MARGRSAVVDRPRWPGRGVFVSKALPVVVDAQPEHPDIWDQADEHARVLGVLDAVAQRLDGDAVQLLLDLVVEDDAWVRSFDTNGDACPGRQDCRLVP